MKLLDAIKHNEVMLKAFIAYLQENKYDYSKILVSDNHLETMIYYISFLESKKTYILVDHNAYTAYTIFSDGKQKIIDCVFIDKPIPIKYILGIILAFNYLETPF